MFYATALFANCKPPPEPTFSLQCAVGALTKANFKVQPYKGAVESGCDAAVAKYAETYYKTIEAELKCKKMSDAAIKCGDKYGRDHKLHAYVMLVHLGWKLEDAKKLDKAWKPQLLDLDKVGDGILKYISKNCHILPAIESSDEDSNEDSGSDSSESNSDDFSKSEEETEE